MFNNDLSNDIFSTTFNNEWMLGLFFGTVVFSLILTIILIISYVKALKKAGESAINILWLFLPVPILGNVMLALKIKPEKFGKGSGYLVGMILLPIIFVPIIAFSEETQISEKQENNSFNAMDVVNANDNINNVIPNNQFNLTDNISVENIPVESVNNVPVSEPVVEMNTMVEPVKEVPNAFSSIPVEPVNNVPVSESVADMNTMVEPVKEVPNSFNSIPVEPVSNISVSEPVADMNTMVEPVKDVPNAFNSIPVELVNNVPVSEPMQIEALQEDLVQIQPLSDEPYKVEEVVITPINSDNKVCKNCGTTLPEIVSICPNCGTDNE